MSEELTHHLQAVQAELASGEPLDAAERAKLEQLLEQIASALQRPQSAASQDEPAQGDAELSLSEQLLQATQELEESHPNLTLAIGQVANALSGIGI